MIKLVKTLVLRGVEFDFSDFLKMRKCSNILARFINYAYKEILICNMFEYN